MATPVSIGANSAGASSLSNTKGVSNVNASAVQGKVQSADEAATMSPAAKARAQLNASIVEASLTVSLKSSNNPMSVVLKTALTGINEALRADFGEDAIQNASAQDNTPEGTASRIVSLSTAFYEAYKQQHPGQDEETTLNNFMDTIKKGVEQGFKEARSMLEGFKVLDGDVAANIDKTYDLIQQGFADFVAARKAPAEAGSAGASGGASASVTIKPAGNGANGANGANNGGSAAGVNDNGAAVAAPGKAVDDGGRFHIDPRAV